MIDLTALAATLTTLRQALATSGNLVDASTLTISQLLVAVVAAEGAASAASAANDAVLGATVSSVGGVVAGGDPLAMAAAFSTYLGFAAQAPDLFDVVNYLGRMEENLVISAGIAVTPATSGGASLPVPFVLNITGLGGGAGLGP